MFKPLKTKDIKNKKVTSVAAIVFNDKSEILIINLIKRGWDIPGGHVEKIDKDVYETLRREVLEEAFSKIKNIKISTVIRSYSNKEPTYMVIFKAEIDELLEFKGNKESIERKFVKPLQFLKIYSKDNDFDLMNKIIENVIKKQ
jgi:8-oxo-dGTP diphosphatase